MLKIKDNVHHVTTVEGAVGFASEYIYNVSTGNVWFAFKTLRKVRW